MWCCRGIEIDIEVGIEAGIDFDFDLDFAFVLALNCNEDRCCFVDCQYHRLHIRGEGHV